MELKQWMAYDEIRKKRRSQSLSIQSREKETRKGIQSDRVKCVKCIVNIDGS